MRMTCRELIEQLIDYLDGTLTAEQRDLIERHLEGCDGCTGYIRTYVVTLRLERVIITNEDVPEELVQSVLAHIKHN